MPAAFKTSGVPCRACGAVLATPDDNRFGLCFTCWLSARAHCGAAAVKGDLEVTEEGVVSWLASKLVKDITRLRRSGIVGRCEAVSGWSYGHPGSQCALPAIDHRDGHKVCGKHRTALSPTYVSDQQSDGYVMLLDMMRDLAAADPRFGEVLQEAAHE